LNEATRRRFFLQLNPSREGEHKLCKLPHFFEYLISNKVVREGGVTQKFKFFQLNPSNISFLKEALPFLLHTTNSIIQFLSLFFVFFTQGLSWNNAS